MPAFKMENFGGEIPATDDRLLPDNAAALSKNTWLFSGRIEPVHALVPLYTMQNAASRAWFRFPKGNPSIDNMIDSYWLEFENQNVRVIRSPTTGQDDDGRFYWADGVFPKYTTGVRIETSAAALRLGIPVPGTAPTVGASGGTGAATTRVYVYTWVSAYGEEGPPSVPTSHTGKLDDTWTIGLTAPTTPDTTDRDLTHTRIYRTIVSTQGISTYYFVAEIPIATLSYSDTQSDAVVALNEQLPSITWFAPPDDLQGLVSMPNGMTVSWRANEVWFSEPYHPHAWPVEYVIAVDALIVGLGVFVQSLIILTQGQPYSATGTDPAQMALAKIQPLEPCTSRNSIVSTPNGVLYSSPNGLINVVPAGALNLTFKTILKDQWSAMMNLDTIAASIVQGGYYACSLEQVGVFQSDAFQIDAFQQESHYGTRPGTFVSLSDQRVGVCPIDPAPVEVQNIITDIFNGETMIMRNGVVYLLDVRVQHPYAKYVWRSKIWTMPYLMNLAAAKIYWTPPDNPPPSDTVFRMYAGAVADLTSDGLPLRLQRTLGRSGEMFRLPSGYKALYYQFEVEGYALINSIHVAQSARDLREV